MEEGGVLPPFFPPSLKEGANDVLMMEGANDGMKVHEWSHVLSQITFQTHCGLLSDMILQSKKFIIVDIKCL